MIHLLLEQGLRSGDIDNLPGTLVGRLNGRHYRQVIAQFRRQSRDPGQVSGKSAMLAAIEVLASEKLQLAHGPHFEGAASPGE
jgi:hypothetical protein